MLSGRQTIPDLGAARPHFLAFMATLITVPVALYVASWLLRGLPSRQTNAIAGTALLWAATALPLYIAAYVRRRRLEVFGEIALTIEPVPLTPGAAFSGWIDVDRNARIVGHEIVLQEVDDEGYARWSSTNLSQGIEASAYSQRIRFVGSLPDRRSQSWRIRTRIRAEQSTTSTHHPLPVVTS